MMTYSPRESHRVQGASPHLLGVRRALSLYEIGWLQLSPCAVAAVERLNLLLFLEDAGISHDKHGACGRKADASACPCFALSGSGSAAVPDWEWPR